MADAKPEEKKPADAKPEEKKPEEKKPADAKPEEKKPTDAKSEVVVAILANKSGEPAFQMKIDADKLSFKSDKLTDEPVAIELKVENSLAKRQTFKVKCTSNEIFRVRPPLGFVEPNGSVKIKVTFQSKEIPEPNKHFFAIYHMSANEKDTQPRLLWTATAKTEGVKRLACSFEKADGSQWPVVMSAPAAADKK